MLKINNHADRTEGHSETRDGNIFAYTFARGERERERERYCVINLADAYLRNDERKFWYR